MPRSQMTEGPMRRHLEGAVDRDLRRLRWMRWAGGESGPPSLVLLLSTSPTPGGTVHPLDNGRGH